MEEWLQPNKWSNIRGAPREVLDYGSVLAAAVRRAPPFVPSVAYCIHNSVKKIREDPNARFIM